MGRFHKYSHDELKIFDKFAFILFLGEINQINGGGIKRFLMHFLKILLNFQQYILQIL